MGNEMEPEVVTSVTLRTAKTAEEGFLLLQSLAFEGSVVVSTLELSDEAILTVVRWFGSSVVTNTFAESRVLGP
jgi:hypothetical protein